MLLERDHAGDVAGFEAGVDVDDTNIGGAGVEHSKERGDAAKAGAIADAGGDGDDGTGDMSADDAGERSFHTGDHDNGVGFSNAVEFSEQPLWTGDADIDDQIGVRPHPIRRFANFLGNRQVTGSGGNDGHDAF